ncbi:E3 Ubiquitin ligase [Jatrophihabitans endophyticus]|uniref:RING-type E3 ubiquitin transferase n=1 Tax=Jatrophihabitans endophyticus TaxID=1206085 RepID=A0A1M5KCK1_9ACTN|nr:GIDE domain-containing protein [Jatrophihabitans endophyticus]SHG50644.1 E3 Ubiquitin ligase [Jatrophihabitans endophyticus]
MRNPGQLLPDHAAVLATLGRSTPVAPGAARPGTVVRTVGTAAAGPGGLLTAPLSGQPCVWFRVLEARHPAWQTLGVGVVPTPAIPPVVGSDVGFPAAEATDHESGEPFAVVGGGGAVLVDPARADVDTPVVPVDGAEGEFRVTTYTLRREWILEEGAEVFVAGAVAGDMGAPVLRATPADCLVVSARGERYVVERARATVAAVPAATARSQRALLVGLLVGGAVMLAVLVALAVVLVG